MPWESAIAVKSIAFEIARIASAEADRRVKYCDRRFGVRHQPLRMLVGVRHQPLPDRYRCWLVSGTSRYCESFSIVTV
jgi:hypothetical protein